uniref:Sugar phosphate transporter domain-containing protein n=1 Tax=Mantoniella antarctica TaxID=81844 RepID=A0A7S0X8P8_9CHLO|mmetsp:Transcript_21413/g.34636  ORF Transcript_21413/g.34636 Transcript_21413/m.34636 type:complete len:345 (-) Transcript_21413:1021-2055(-)
MAPPLTAWQQAAKAYFYVVIWMSISMGVILFNKYILAYSGFKYPIALTLWHMVFCTSIATTMVRVLGVTKRLHMPQKEYINRVVPIGALYAASLWLSNSAYLHLSVSFIQMTKALMPGLVYVCGVALGMEKLTGVTSFNMCIIAVGVAIAAYGEINFIWVGVAEQLSALVFEATRLMLVQVLITRQGYSMNPIQSLYYVSPACAAFLALPFVVVELPDILANTALVINYPMLLLNAITAFGLNLAVFLLIGKTSALTMNIAGVIKDWMLIFASQHLFGNSVSFLNYLGYVIAFLAVGMYNYNKMRSMKQKEQAVSKDRESGKADKEAAEAGGGGGGVEAGKGNK